MKIKLRYLALGLLALLGSFVVSSQRISAHEAIERLSAPSASAPSVLGTGKYSLSSGIPAPGTLLTYTTYLPVVMKDYLPGIYGYLTQNGAPIGDLSLELRFYDGTSYSTEATATTNSSGYYLFSGVPALGAGQSYYVLYRNPEENDSRVSSWGSAEIASYTIGSSISLGKSDVANITLVAPGPYTTIALPYLFQWIPRSTTPSDNYSWILFDPYGSARTTVGSLGYVGSYNRTTLPSGFSIYTAYGWYVGFVEPGPLGGIGYSYYYNPVAFTNTGASISSPPDTAPRAIGRRDMPPPHRHPRK